MSEINLFSLYWSVFATIVSVLLFGWDIGQLVSRHKEREIRRKETEKHKSQVKIWQHHADGISRELLLLGGSSFRDLEDLKISVNAVHASAYSLYRSLNEERLFTEEEVKEKQLELERRNQEMIDNFKNKPKFPSVTKPVVPMTQNRQADTNDNN